MNRILLAAAASLALFGAANADPVDLTTYADKDGYIHVQKLTCAQLAITFQEDADHVTTSAGLRCGQENQGQEATYPGRYAGPDAACDRASR